MISYRKESSNSYTLLDDLVIQLNISVRRAPPCYTIISFSAVKVCIRSVEAGPVLN